MPSTTESYTSFNSFRPGRTLSPIWAVTPPGEKHIHTFFDVCPWSPDEKYLLTIKLPFDDHEPTSSDHAELYVTDLSNGTRRAVASTAAWALQVGAHQQWGVAGHCIYYNDFSSGKVICKEFDIDSGSQRHLNGPLYQVSPDGSYILGPSMERINFVQRGYGAPLTDPNYVLESDASQNDGLWRTDIKTGKSDILLTTHEMCKAIGFESKSSDTWTILFHTKFNMSGDRILQVVRRLRWENGPKWERFIVTFRPDGSDVQLALSPAMWSVPGHHPHWHPDCENITMNLTDKAGEMRFCKFGYDGKGFAFMHTEVPGGGHPSYNSQADILLTDAYVEEPISLKNDEVPIRLVSDYPAKERTVSYLPVIPAIPEQTGQAAEQRIPPTLKKITAGDLSKLVNKQSALDVFRVDPHPVWNRDYSKVCINATPKGNRTVLIADVSALIKDIAQPRVQGDDK